MTTTIMKTMTTRDAAAARGTGGTFLLGLRDEMRVATLTSGFIGGAGGHLRDQPQVPVTGVTWGCAGVGPW